MPKILIGVLGTLGTMAVIAVVIAYGGFIDMAADTPHSPGVYRLIEFTRERSVDRRSQEVTPPADWWDASRVKRGAGNYAAMCAGCHLSPGVTDSEIRRGLYPQPPDLVRSVVAPSNRDRIAARRFWIIKHGIKASGMPAWSRGGMEDAAIWDLTAFLERLPTLSADQYRDIVEASEGHSHAGMDDGAAGGDPAHHAPAREHHQEPRSRQSASQAGTVTLHRVPRWPREWRAAATSRLVATQPRELFHEQRTSRQSRPPT